MSRRSKNHSIIYWNYATKSKPESGDRVLLSIRGESCPVVGYWDSSWQVCNENIEFVTYGYDAVAYLEPSFKDSDVTHWAYIGFGEPMTWKGGD